MALDALRTRLGIGGRRRRFIDIEDVRDLEEISDPETTSDESGTSVREWAMRHPAWAVVSGLALLIAGGLLVRFTARFTVTLVTSPWTYAAIGAALVLGYTYRNGWRRRDTQVTDWDELTLKQGGDSVAYKGRFVELSGRADAFIPIKGWSGVFSSPRPYANGEIAAGLNESFDPWQMDESKAAIIRLEPGENGSLVSISDTEWGGKKIVQETNGVKPDPTGNHTSLQCSLPDFGDERANELREQLEQLMSDLHDAWGENDALRRRNRNLKERMNEPIEDELEQRIGQYERLAAVSSISRGRGRSRGETVPPKPRADFAGNGSAASNGADAEFQQVEEELSDDE
ncbi:hypothetical protein [Halobaculum magnesiiphilum]|uniref:Uncharacterized protein n=1 Tax=Halobaculum magnesiiphilum TaxID=1017351 RepID=A0A8T8WBF7_9EURY|nr:hypothetical protein [Halobaculum magnesiiphilum]QZP37084.1 hypothetical protein K6T50_12400 [Halobaculum magnesiiphilum]